MKQFLFCIALLSAHNTFSQIDSSLLVASNTPYGALDIRIARSTSNYYYLQDSITFSYRQHDNASTNTFFDMTAWESEQYKQGNLRERKGNDDLFIMNYRYLEPINYDGLYEQGYPLVLLLHGLSESGNCADGSCYHASTSYSPNTNDPPAPSDERSQLLNNDYNLAHGGSNYLDAVTAASGITPDDPSLPARGFPGFVVVPQNLNGWDGNAAEDAIRLIRLFIKKYNIDVNRIYINGVSNGGHGAFEVLKRAPWLFGAGILFSPADDGSVIDQQMHGAVANVPLWIFQGSVDKNPLPKNTEAYIDILKDKGANIRYTKYEGIGHGTWNKAFSEPDFFSWMLRQRRNNIQLFAGEAVICSTNGKGATLTVSPGFSNYEWQFNGEVVPDSNKNSLIATTPGSYRSRFQDYNGRMVWSDSIRVSEKNTSPPEVIQVGTILLKDLNQNNRATLKAKTQHEHYYWLRDGVRISFPGKENDTISVAEVNPVFGSGSYTLQVADFDGCISPPSNPKHLFFNNEAPLNIPSPTGLQVSANSPSSTELIWQDESDSEDGFEIWRKTIGDSSRWLMVTLISGNTTSFVDDNLSPNSSYEYTLRAVSSTGRSEYSAHQNISTLRDETRPSAPTHLTASIEGVKALQLSWSPSVDDSSIKGYIIRTMTDTIQTADTMHVFKNFIVNTDYTFSVQALDAGGNLSDPSDEVQIRTSMTGLFYQHSTGNWRSLQEIDWQIAEFKGTVGAFTLQPKTQDDFFNFRFEGFLNIVQNGIYQFRISSDDGSELFLDDSLLIANDGIHNLATVTAPIQLLASGPHLIAADFFDNTLSDTLIVEYKGPDTGNEWSVIPEDKLRSEIITDVEDPVLSSEIKMEVFPNPVSGTEINLLIVSSRESHVMIDISDITGKIIASIHDVGSPAGKPIMMSTVSLPNGLYFISARTSNARVVKKIVVQR